MPGVSEEDRAAGRPARLAVPVSVKGSVELPCDRLVVYCGPRRGAPLVPEEITAALGEAVAGAAERAGFTGAEGDVLVLDTLGRLPAREVSLVGVGPSDQLSGAAVSSATRRALGGSRVETVGLCLDVVGAPQLQAAIEGAVIGAHRFSLSRATSRRGAPEPGIEVRLAQGELGARWERDVELGRVLAGSVCWARDLVDLPSNVVSPQRMAEEARELTRVAPVACEVLEVAELERLGFGGVLGVGGGGEHPPCVVVLRYEPTGGRPVGLVGKGVTFDSGGYKLKQLDEMLLMKSDMAGAAAVMGAVRAAALCGLDQDVVAVLPCVENLIGGRSFRPGDTLVQFGGTTCEVADPDNEGRLIVADALGYVGRLDPALVVDVATLTDAGGLGRDLWALFANDEGLATEVLLAGRQAGEPGWRLPLWAPYRRQLRSHVAEVANADRSTDSAVLAAAFLSHFVGATPWAHVDLGDTALCGPGFEEATGVGVRMLWHLLANRTTRRAVATGLQRVRP